MNLSSIICLRRLTKATVFFTLFLIFVGALVKSHEVGLSVPDWPTTYGKQMFAFPLSDRSSELYLFPSIVISGINLKKVDAILHLKNSNG